MDPGSESGVLKLNTAYCSACNCNSKSITQIISQSSDRSFTFLLKKLAGSIKNEIRDTLTVMIYVLNHVHWLHQYEIKYGHKKVKQKHVLSRFFC